VKLPAEPWSGHAKCIGTGSSALKAGLFRCALDFYRAAPWTRWHHGIVLTLETSLGDSEGGWAAVVMGNSGIQHGLVLHPGGNAPEGLDEWEPGVSLPMPSHRP
jgi:hypothetical protein